MLPFAAPPVLVQGVTARPSFAAVFDLSILELITNGTTTHFLRSAGPLWCFILSAFLHWTHDCGGKQVRLRIAP